MLRHDSESSRPGLGRKIIRTSFQAIFDFQKMSFLVLQVAFFFKKKLPPESQLNHETYVFFYTSDPKISKSKLFTPLTPKVSKSKLFTLLTPRMSKSKLFTLLTPKISKSKLFTLLIPKYPNRNCLHF